MSFDEVRTVTGKISQDNEDISDNKQKNTGNIWSWFAIKSKPRGWTQQEEDSRKKTVPLTKWRWRWRYQCKGNFFWFELVYECVMFPYTLSTVRPPPPQHWQATLVVTMNCSSTIKSNTKLPSMSLSLSPSRVIKHQIRLTLSRLALGYVQWEYGFEQLLWMKKTPPRKCHNIDLGHKYFARQQQKMGKCI